MKKVYLNFFFFFLAIILLLPFSCEKDEMIVIDDGLQFCPVNFIYKEKIFYTGDCPAWPNKGHLPQISTDEEGVVLRQGLYENNTPYFSWADSMDSYLAFNIFDTASRVVFKFDKIDMDTGARVGLFLGNCMVFGTRCAEATSSAGASGQPFQIWIRRAASGQYEFGATAKGQEFFYPGLFDDFGMAVFTLESSFGKIRLSGRIDARSGMTNYLADWAVELPFDPAKPYFAGVGMELLPWEKKVCGEHPVQLRLLFYQFKNSAGYERNDSFECNTIAVVQ